MAMHFLVLALLQMTLTGLNLKVEWRQIHGAPQGRCAPTLFSPNSGAALPPPDKEYPSESPDLIVLHVVGGYIKAGGDLEVAEMNLVGAWEHCLSLPDCRGFSWKGDISDGQATEVFFKNKWVLKGDESSGWFSVEISEERRQELEQALGHHHWPVGTFPVAEKEPASEPGPAAEPVLEAKDLVVVEGFLKSGGDIEVSEMTLEDAKQHCLSMPDCRGFTWEGDASAGQTVELFFKTHFVLRKNDAVSTWYSVEVERKTLETPKKKLRKRRK